MFNKVERLFLLGMRASDPLRRQRFFELYHGFIAHGLFERLQFIICAQDWQVRISEGAGVSGGGRGALQDRVKMKSALDRGHAGRPRRHAER